MRTDAQGRILADLPSFYQFGSERFFMCPYARRFAPIRAEVFEFKIHDDKDA